MAKTKISEFSSTPANNTDIDSINIAEGCAPSGINDAIRELMAQLKDFQTGAQGDSFNGPIGTSTAAAGAFTTLSATGAITSTLATGTAPLVIASTTKVANLNVDLLDGADWASPAALGSTTPAAVSATTLSASSTVTLSGGTANGVAYLNGSKVVTSGSALVYGGSNLILTSGGTWATDAGGIQLSMNGNDGYLTTYFDTHTVTIGAGVSAKNQIKVSGAGGANNINFKVNSSDAMTLTSTGLGIGTSSPVEKVQSSNGVAATGANQSVGSLNGFVADYSSGASRIFASRNGVASSTLELWTTDSGGAANKNATLDSSGNLGLGVTPSANSLSKGFDLLGGAGLFGYSNNNYLTANTYYDGAFKYKANGFASYYGQGSGAHQWHTAASGTAGNAITFTQAMTLDSSGNLAIGQTTASSRLHINGESRFTDGTSTVKIVNSSAIGFFGTLSNHPLAFITNDTERARIDSSGNLLVGQTSETSSAYRFNLKGDNGIVITPNADNYTAASFRNAAVSQVGTIGVSSTATAYNTSSDYRLKNTIAPMTGALAKVALLKPCTYKWNVDGSDGQGFIAHELAEVCPQAVTGEKDAVDEEGNPKYQGIDTSFLVATLTAALQEAVAKINSLEARLDAANL